MSVTLEEVRALDGEYVGEIVWSIKMESGTCVCKAEGRLRLEGTTIFIDKIEGHKRSWRQGCKEGIPIDKVWWIDEDYYHDKE